MHDSDIFPLKIGIIIIFIDSKTGYSFMSTELNVVAGKNHSQPG